MNTEHVVALIGRVRERANALIIAELEKHGHEGLAPSHGAILHTLFSRGPMPMGALAEAIGRRKNTVTTLVRKLEEAGYVVRMPSREDSRVMLVSPSTRALDARADFEGISRTLLDAVWGDMPQADRETLVKGLETVLQNLGKK